jgi:hypothetical protein
LKGECLPQFIGRGPENLAPAPLGNARDGPRERRLADARLALDQHGAPTTRDEVVDPFPELGELAVPPDKGGRTPHASTVRRGLNMDNVHPGDGRPG